MHVVRCMHWRRVTCSSKKGSQPLIPQCNSPKWPPFLFTSCRIARVSTMLGTWAPPLARLRQSASAHRYHHVQGAIHITPGGLIKLRSRPWHCKLMPNVSHHLMASYRSGIPGLGGLGQLGAAAHDWLEDEGPGSNGELPMRDTKAVPGIFFWRCVSARGD